MTASPFVLNLFLFRSRLSGKRFLSATDHSSLHLGKTGRDRSIRECTYRVDRAYVVELLDLAEAVGFDPRKAITALEKKR